MSKTNLIEDELDLLIDSVLEAAPPSLKARCVKEDILIALRETCGIYDRDTLRIMLDYDYGVVRTALGNAAPAAFVALLKDGKVPPYRKSWFYFIPAINIFYDIFSDECPPMAHLPDALNNIMVVCTLMLGFDMSLITSVGYEDATKLIDRCSLNATNGTGCWSTDIVGIASLYPDEKGGDGETIIDYFFWSGNLAVYMLGSSLMTSILFAAVLATTGEDADYQSARPGKVWWAYARWVYAWIVVTLVAGIFLSTIAYHFAVLMNYPDNTTEHHAYIVPGVDPNFNWQSSSGGGLWILNPLYISVFVLGIALARMAKASNATPGRCTNPVNSTIRSGKDDLPSEVTELGSVVN